MNINPVSSRSIALLGTSADPPTNGHKALLIGLSKLFPKVVTWASDNPAKKHSISLIQRYELLNILVETIAIPNLELKQELSSKWAVNTLDEAAKYWPDNDFFLIIGSDLIQDLPTWHEAKNLVKKASLGIVPREGWPLNKADLQLIHDLGGQTEVLPLKIPATASSAVRCQPILSQIPEAILPILQQKNLYGIPRNIQ